MADTTGRQARTPRECALVLLRTSVENPTFSAVTWELAKYGSETMEPDIGHFTKTGPGKSASGGSRAVPSCGVVFFVNLPTNQNMHNFLPDFRLV